MLLLPRGRDGWRWSAGRGQGAQPVPAGDEGVVPGPVRADLQVPFPGVADETGGQVPDPVAERVRLRILQLRLVMEADEPGPGGEVGGDVRREGPALVNLPRLAGKVAQSHGLRGPDAVGLDGGVVAVGDVD